METDKLADEFKIYQLLSDDDIDQRTWKEAKENNFIRMDIIWSYLFKKENCDGSKTFEYLNKLLNLF